MFGIFPTLCVSLLLGVSGAVTDGVSLSVMEGESVTLPSDIKMKQKDKIRWYFNDTRIAEINGNLSYICTDDQCNEGTERFRDRLKLDNQTGSLTIMNIRTTDSGVYQLHIGNPNIKKTFNVAVHGVSVEVSVMEGDSVTLYTGVETSQQEDIKWYFSSIRIAQISGDLIKICTDVQCNEGTERFRDRLKLDHQTGSLTITNITDTDSGVYKLKIISSSSDSETIFNVTVQGVSAADRDEVKRKSVMEGESFTFDPGVTKNTNDSMMWYFNDTLIAEITGDQSQICTDDQCKERFRDRLKLDHQNGSLTITNTRNTDTGDYKLEMMFINSSFSITRVKRFSVSVIAVPGSGLSSGAVAGIVVVVVVLLVAVALAVIYNRRSRSYAPPAQVDDDL